MSICAAALWYTSGRLPLCSNYPDMAAVHQFSWFIQHIPLESTYLSSSFTILHVSVLKEDQTKWMDVVGWDFIVHNRVQLSI
ncbi:hypothetical protein Syun_010169 [Stephania yunnanensis]|uniref:Uncharacterized protein n=1 Tax=Stephania yunnanensis TaxID=152371 RepID=A0AAP0KIK8_9MAGN